MRVMVLVKTTPETEEAAMPSEQALTEMMAFNEELVNAGVMVDGDGLSPSSRGARVRWESGEVKVIDGPFTESKELVAGYWLWEVKSLEEAIEYAKRIPNTDGQDGEGEIRPSIQPEEFGDALTPELQAKSDELRAKEQELHARGWPTTATIEPEVSGVLASGSFVSWGCFTPSGEQRHPPDHRGGVADRVDEGHRRHQPARARRRLGRGTGPGLLRRRTGAMAPERDPRPTLPLADAHRQEHGDRSDPSQRHPREQAGGAGP